MLKLAILGSGYGSNFQAIIDAIEFDGLSAEVVCVISDVKDAHILTRAKNNQIPNYYIDCYPFKNIIKEAPEKNLISVLMEHEPDLIVLAGFMRVLGSKIIKKFSNKNNTTHKHRYIVFLNSSISSLIETGIKFSFFIWFRIP